mgnify:CR=1 FL=1
MKVKDNVVGWRPYDHEPPSHLHQVYFIMVATTTFMSRLLVIAAELSAPPSTPSTFRELTMFGSIYYHYDVVSVAPEDMIPMYSSWFHTYGLWDYLTDLGAEGEIRPDEITTEITGGTNARLTIHNLYEVLTHL